MKSFGLVIAVVVMVCFATSAMAVEVKIYGWADLSVDLVDHGETNETYLVNNASNLGFRFEEKLGDNLKGFAQFEALFGLDGEGNGNSDADASDPPFLNSRNSGVGLISPYGSLVLGGSWNEPLKVSSGGLDPFVTRNGQWGSIINRGYRAKNQVLFISPKFEGLQFQFAKAFDEGDNKAAAGPGDLFSSDVVGGNITYRNMKSPIGDVFAGIGYRNENNFRGFNYDNEVLRVSTGYGFRYNKNWFTRLGFIYSKDELTENTLDVTAMMGTLSHKMRNVQLNLSYGQAKDDISNREQKLMAAGIDYHISKQLKVYLIYAALKLDNSATELYPFGGAGRNELLPIDPDSDEVSAISFGIRYFFKPGYQFNMFEKKK